MIVCCTSLRAFTVTTITRLRPIMPCVIESESVSANFWFIIGQGVIHNIPLIGHKFMPNLFKWLGLLSDVMHLKTDNIILLSCFSILRFRDKDISFTGNALFTHFDEVGVPITVQAPLSSPPGKGSEIADTNMSIHAWFKNRTWVYIITHNAFVCWYDMTFVYVIERSC